MSAREACAFVLAFWLALTAIAVGLAVLEREGRPAQSTEEPLE